MLYSSNQPKNIESRKLVFDKVFKNKYQKSLAQQEKYLYFKVLSKLKSKFQTNKQLTKQLFHQHQRPKSTSKLTTPSSQTIYKVNKINNKLFKLQAKDNFQPTFLAQSPVSSFRRSYSRSVQSTNTVIMKRRNTQQLMQPIQDSNVKPRLRQLIKKHKQAQKSYRLKQMQKYFKTQQIQVWNELPGKLITLKNREKTHGLHR